MKRIFVVATKDGRLPTRPFTSEKQQSEILKVSETLYPNEDFRVYEFTYEPSHIPAIRKKIHLKGDKNIIENMVKGLAFASGDYEIVDANKES